MRPIKLTMQAFGAYAGRQEVDFRELGGRNFFLIHGPTGSGKTTILDAICFALYGATSGGERRDVQMRSDHAGPAVPTEVSFDFSLGSRLFRVVRRPEQELKKQRGEGTTKKLQSAALFERTAALAESEDGVLLESRWSQVNARVTGLLGFECDQFRQVVVIPQGKFRELLNAPGKDRQEILRVLFQTGQYQLLQDELKAMRSALAKQLDEVKGRVAHLLAEAEAGSAEELEQKKGALGEETRHLKERREALEGERGKHQRQLDEARKIAEKLKELEDSRRALEALRRGEAAHGARQREAQRARAAQPLVPEEAALKQVLADARAAEAQREKSECELAAATQARAEAAGALERETARESEREAARVAVHRLRDMREKVGGLEALRQALERAAAELKDQAAGRDRTAKNKETLAGRIEELRGRREAELARAAGAGALSAEVKRLAELLNLLERLEKARRELAAAEKKAAAQRVAAEALRGEMDQARAALESAEQRWLRGQAAILARGLAAGAPCPVCGSTAHPAPAAAAHDLPEESAIRAGREAVSALQAKVEEAGRKETEAQVALGKAQEREAEIRQTLEGLGEEREASRPALEKKLRENKAELDAAERARAALPELESDLAREGAEAAALETRLAELAAAVNAATAAEAEARARLEAAQRDIPEALRRREALAQTLARAEADARILEEALEAARQRDGQAGERLARCEAEARGAAVRVEELGRRAAIAQNEFDVKLRLAEFKDCRDYADAIRAPEQIAALEREIKKYHEDLAAARARHAAAEAAAAGLQTPDIPALEAAVREVHEQIDAVSGRQGELKRALDQVEKWLAALGDSVRRQERLEKEYAVIGRVAEVVAGSGGANPHNLSFERFIQGVWLDRVLARASLRLARMSRERFLIKRQLDPVHGRAAGGLDLQIHDNYTGTDRPVATLSGGESFMASLALALGLADIVQARSGGIYLETIFVDEGFGSLDPEALDLALATLVDLQQGGRLVGIISHVPELKERIDVRLEIEAEKNGSRARFHVS